MENQGYYGNGGINLGSLWVLADDDVRGSVASAEVMKEIKVMARLVG